MFAPKFLLLFGLLLAVLLDPISGRKGSHSYPKSGGLSGGGHRSGGLSGGGHGYPSSGGHGYPSSGGLSGGGSGYPASGNRGYPHATNNQGYPPAGGNRGYPPASGGHGYPSSGGGLSGNGHGYPSNNKPHTTNIVNNYHYTPPQQIRYTPVSGGPPVNYPVYHGQPPSYVYKYKDSNSKYGTLLAGLALMNLGTLGVAAYALHNSNSHGGSSAPVYKAQPGEVCKFAVKKENGDYEETRIDCQIISGFILEAQANNQHSNTGTNSTVTTTTTVTNVTTVNMPNADQTATVEPVKVLYEMLANGTLVPVNVTTNATVHTEANQTTPAANGTMASSVTVTTTTTNTTLVNALDVKGKPVDVTPGMQCFIIRNSPTSNMRKTVPCGVLQTYADKSIQRNSATKHVPMFTVMAAVVAYCVAY